MPKKCTICLNPDEKITQLNHKDENGFRILENLQKCVPEVDWKVGLEICGKCERQVESVCAFRELCIKSYNENRGNLQELKSELPDTSQEEEEEEPGDEVFICYHCCKGFKLKKSLENHLKHSHKEVFLEKNGEEEEEICIKSYNDKWGNLQELKSELPEEKEVFICYQCEKCFKLKKSLENHLKKCHQEHQEPEVSKENIQVVEETSTAFICDTCGATFTNKYLLKRHARNVHATEKKFQCDLCNRKFASPVYLSAHKRYHSGERKHICSFCGKGYITASDLYHHEKIHANKRAYRCEICPKAFNTSSDLHKHKICVHQDRSKWKYECTFCQRKFPLKTNLDTHTKTHTGEKNFLCHLCDRKCINRSVLRRHIESHSVVKSFKCEVCQQGYKYKKSLDIHKVKAHGIGDVKVPERVKKYFCSICPKSYFANNKLQKHIRSHTGERPFQCPECDKCFIDKSYVKQHLKSAHNVTNSNN